MATPSAEATKTEEGEALMDKIGPKDVYKNLWICRDFEVDHLWQRSIFLAGFLLACFGGYGALAVSVLFPDPDAKAVSKELVNAVAFGICLIGIVLSLLWLMMAKGSKAWYERYEQAIEGFAKSYPGAFDEGMERLEGFHWEKMPQYERKPTSDCPFNPKGGKFSPSKINYGIGIVSIVIWILLAAAHIVIAACGCKPLAKCPWLIKISSNWIILTAVGVIVFVATILWGLIGLRSSFLKENK